MRYITVGSSIEVEIHVTVYGNADYYIAHNSMILACLFMFVLFAEVDSPINLDDSQDIETINLDDSQDIETINLDDCQAIETINLDDSQDIQMEDQPREQDNVSICNRTLF